jgi:hypothetical protein
MPIKDEKPIPGELDAMFGQVLRGLADEVLEMQNMKIGCHVVVSREFSEFTDGKYAGMKIKLTVEPDQESYE